MIEIPKISGFISAILLLFIWIFPAHAGDESTQRLFDDPSRAQARAILVPVVADSIKSQETAHRKERARMLRQCEELEDSAWAKMHVAHPELTDDQVRAKVIKNDELIRTCIEDYGFKP